MVVVIQRRLGHWLEAHSISGCLLAFELRGDVQRKAAGVAMHHVITDNAGRVCSSKPPTELKLMLALCIWEAAHIEVWDLCRQSIVLSLQPPTDAGKE